MSTMLWQTDDDIWLDTDMSASYGRQLYEADYEII